jgi:hypothetical protein
MTPREPVLMSHNAVSGRILIHGRAALYEWPTYRANLCPLCGGAEFTSLGEDFGEPI